MDPVLFWNGVMLEASRRDFTLGFGRTLPGIPGQVDPRHAGPTRTSRAMAIVSIAIHDAVCAGRNPQAAYLTKRYHDPVSAPVGADLAQLISGAASAALTLLYPNMADYFGTALDQAMGRPGDDGFRAGLAIGSAAFNRRRADPVTGNGTYQPTGQAGRHRADPYNPHQGYLTAQWGDLERFTGQPRVGLAPPPGLGSPDYDRDAHEVMETGVRGSQTRTPEETSIGLFWGYDGAFELGVPPRFYNQIARQILMARGAALEEEAEALAVLNVAMADAGIDAWHWKYAYDFWRPVAAFNPVGQLPAWQPVGLPRTNDPSAEALTSMTPNFPAYPSGHASFGAAGFQGLRLCLFPERAPIGLGDVLAEEPEDQVGEGFEAVSDELNELSLDPGPMGHPRPRSPRRFVSFAHAVRENALSRVFLGVHWRFDGLPRTINGPQYGGVALGLEIGAQAHALFATAPSLGSGPKAA